MRHIARFLIGALICGPLSVTITLVAWPFWRWLEAVSGIESIGHSGPAAWCFAAVYVLLLCVLVLLWRARR
jgi:uncharacterized membrane protein YidH (DUF202 family)